MPITHILGFPRIGQNRELKKAQESYWKNETSSGELLAAGDQICQENWQRQKEAGLDYITAGDFSFYDHILDHCVLFGALPERCQQLDRSSIDQFFAAARGTQVGDKSVHPGEMKKWFNTNYHYIVPEYNDNQVFKIHSKLLFDKIYKAKKIKEQVKPVIVGPLTLLWLGKTVDGSDKFNLIDNLLSCYQELFVELKNACIEWVQIDEPILALDLPEKWVKAFKTVYKKKFFSTLNCLLTTYFGEVTQYVSELKETNIKGLHIDVISAPDQLAVIDQIWPIDKVLSVGIISGNNIWSCDIEERVKVLAPFYQKRQEKLWLAPSCSLLHSPLDKEKETKIPVNIVGALSFSNQKLIELNDIAKGVSEGLQVIKSTILDNKIKLAALDDLRFHNANQRNKEYIYQERTPFNERRQLQKSNLNLPLLPTTTIGSFPQTLEIRQVRAKFKRGEISQSIYQEHIKAFIDYAIKTQEDLGLDVLVHGEPERNDMVEFFGEMLEGIVTSKHGWVQSYGSRYVKPPIIYADVNRPRALTVQWIEYAQSLTPHPVKGMLTGPVTILAWSFVRDDKKLVEVANQIAYALRDEVKDLESVGIKLVQIDEPALRELLPLNKKEWHDYFAWAIQSFKIVASGASAKTQIHTHMCYSEFNGIIEQISALDADVITIECARSNMRLLQVFDDFDYPNEIGPGVYDIHSPNIPTIESISQRIESGLKYLPVDRFWINPDCGLKTRTWPEVSAALVNVVAAAKKIRKEYEVSGKRSRYE